MVENEVFASKKGSDPGLTTVQIRFDDERSRFLRRAKSKPLTCGTSAFLSTAGVAVDGFLGLALLRPGRVFSTGCPIEWG